MEEDAVPDVLGRLGAVTVRMGDVSLLGDRQYISNVVSNNKA